MKNPFRKRAKEVRPPHPLFVSIQRRLEARLKQFAAFLQARTTTWTVRKKKTVLVLFCFAFASASSWIAYDNLQKKSVSLLKITPLLFVPLANGDEPSPRLPSKELRRVHLFKHYLDSLRNSEGGQTISDSLLLNRPHLMDTLNYLEGIYHNEQKNDANGKEETSH